MRTVPFAESDFGDVPDGFQIVTIGDPLRDMHAVEYLVGPSPSYEGAYTYTAVIELDDDERRRVTEGAGIFLVLDGGEVPWSLIVENNPENNSENDVSCGS